jgi:hypothetical protein
MARRPAGPSGMPMRRGAGAAALVSVSLGFFVIQLDVTIVNVALPAIQREIGGSLAGLQWVIDACTLALASIMLTAGSAADRAGARRVFVAGLAAFAVGSVGCAAAPDLGVLIISRAVQGLGASALLPCSLALIVHQFPDPRARARALGVWAGMGSRSVGNVWESRKEPEHDGSRSWLPLPSSPDEAAAITRKPTRRHSSVVVEVRAVNDAQPGATITNT